MMLKKISMYGLIVVACLSAQTQAMERLKRTFTLANVQDFLKGAAYGATRGALNQVIDQRFEGTPGTQNAVTSASLRAATVIATTKLQQNLDGAASDVNLAGQLVGQFIGESTSVSVSNHSVGFKPKLTLDLTTLAAYLLASRKA